LQDYALSGLGSLLLQLCKPIDPGFTADILNNITAHAAGIKLDMMQMQAS
jgi:hypothetical protein